MGRVVSSLLTASALALLLGVLAPTVTGPATARITPSAPSNIKTEAVNSKQLVGQLPSTGTWTEAQCTGQAAPGTSHSCAINNTGKDVAPGIHVQTSVTIGVGATK